MVLDTLADSLLGNMLAGKRVVRDGGGVIRAGKGAIEMTRGRGTNRVGQDF